MRIGILSFTSSDNNYGQLLQCYALQTYLRKLGHEAEHVRFTPTSSKREQLSSLEGISRYLRRNMNWRFVVNASRKLRMSGAGDADRAFERFRGEVLHTNRFQYASIDDLRRNPPVEDVYLAGSDQIWGSDLSNPDTAGWYLDFGGPEVRRVSYAASIGRSLTADELPLFADQLKRFDALSVRERGAKEACVACGFDAEVVVDPTLLLDAEDYRSLAGDGEPPRTPARPYLFAYILNVLYPNDIHWQAFKEYAEVRGLQVAPVYSSGYYTAYPIIRGIEPLYPTIPEWVGLLERSECVVTPSFHGVVFSILFRRPFLALPLPGSKGKGNDRIETLLSALGLEERIFDPSQEVARQMDAPIDWAAVGERLDALRKSSKDYLARALER